MAEAAKFSASKTYAIGDLCLMNGYLYRFTANHTGAWDAADVAIADTDMGVTVNRVIHDHNEAKNAAAFAESVLFEPQQIIHTRYRYRLTE